MRIGNGRSRTGRLRCVRAGSDGPPAVGKRQVLWCDQLAFTQNGGALETVAQLSHVAGPRVMKQQPLGVGRNACRSFAESLGELCKERFAERQDVVCPFPQRRQLNRKYMEAIEEVFP